jgi:hypothetical protein
MYYKLLDCGVPVKHLVYNKVGARNPACYAESTYQEACPVELNPSCR